MSEFGDNLKRESEKYVEMKQREAAAEAVEKIVREEFLARDLEAFAQMLRFTQTTGRSLYIEAGRDAVTIRNVDHDTYNDGAVFRITGWQDSEPDLLLQGHTFAAAWEKFCGYWPEARRC